MSSFLDLDLVGGDKCFVKVFNKVGLNVKRDMVWQEKTWVKERSHEE